MTKATIRIIALLITLTTAGITVFQVNWLVNSYAISKEKIRQDINALLDDALQQHKRQVADSVRKQMKQLVRSEKDFRYGFFTFKDRTSIGFHNPEHKTIISFPVAGTDSDRIKSSPYHFLISKMDASSFDELIPIYSALIGNRDYPANLTNEKIAIHLAHTLDLYKDTLALTAILKRRFTIADIPFNGHIHYYPDLNKVYNEPRWLLTANKKASSQLIEMVIGTDRDPLALKLDKLNNRVQLLNRNGDTCYVAKPLLYNVNDIIMDKIPVLVLAVNTPVGLIISKMLVNIIASAILLICNGLCIAYLLRIIFRQKKTADIKNDFISNITHELKTPVATALAAVQGMQYFDVLKDPDKTHSYLATAAGEIKRLATMINKIINVSIFESTGFKLNPTKFNLKKLLIDIITGQQLRQEKDIKISLDYQAREELIADSQYLQNVILNLIDNAINYSNEEVRINIQCTNIGNQLQILIGDNGIGIKPEYQKIIFDKFFRIPDTNTRGYGLGLNYAKKILELHNGFIAVANSGPGGSVFIINLPG